MMLCYDVMLRCYVTMLCYDAMLPCYVTMPCYDAMLRCHVTMLCYDAMLRCYVTMLCYDAMLRGGKYGYFYQYFFISAYSQSPSVAEADTLTQDSLISK